MKRIVFLCLTVFLMSSAEARSVKITFSNVKFTSKVRLFEVKEQRESEISETKVVKDLKNAPIEKEITGPIEVPAPGSKSFALIVENKTDKDLYFFASPHHVKPSENALGFHFECLCIHHVFRVPPQRVWYRIVRVIFEKDSKYLPNEINHSIIGLTPDVALRDYAKQIYSYGPSSNE